MSIQTPGNPAYEFVQVACRWLRQLSLTLGVASVLVSASGCATTESVKSALLRPSDPYCNVQYNELDKFDDIFGKAILAGLGTAIAAGLLTDDATVGVLAGLVAFLAADYALTLQQQEEAKRRTLYLSTVSAENEMLDDATVSFNKLTECRFAAARKVKADWRAGRVPKAQAEEELARLSELFDWDLKLAREMQVRVDKRGEEFADAITLAGGEEAAQELRSVSPAPAPVAASAAAPAPAATRARRETRKYSNVRSGPGTSHPKVDTLAPGTTVEWLGPAEDVRGWSRIRLANGREAFIATSLLMEPGAEPEPTTRPVPAPEPASEVVAVTQSNQLKRQAFASSINQASTTSEAVFQLGTDEKLGRLSAPEAWSRT